MATASKSTDRNEVQAVEGKEVPNGTAALYWREVERYNRAVSDWHQTGDEITDVYLDANRSAASSRKYALLWANVETLKPAVYAKAPNVMCSRRYKDKDPIARTASEIMERACNTSFDLYGIDEVLRAVRDDRLLPGRGQAWVRYEALIETYQSEEYQQDDATGEMVKGMVDAERLASEKMCVDYVHWKDFGHNMGRTWSDVWLVWRICYKSQDEMAERFGAEEAAKLSYSAQAPVYGTGAKTDNAENKCKVYEFWDKNRKLTSWMVDGTKTFLESGPPPIDFMLGFPCPEPCYATKTTKQLLPQPDYMYYRDQAKEINDLTDKIHNLTQWLIVKGFIPNAPSGIADPIEEALRDKNNSELFQTVESYSEFTEKGGTAKLIDWLPIDKVVMALKAAIEARDKLIMDVFQITGISDVLRGQTDPNETLGAQELKAQTGSRRLKNTKDEIARFARDISRLVAEGIAEKFRPESLAEITGFKYQPPAPPMPQLLLAGPPGSSPAMGGAMPPQPQMPAQMPPQMGQQPMTGDTMQGGDNMTFDDQVVELLRNDKMRGFRIEIETDSTVQADENAEKQRRIEFVGAVGPYLKQAAEAITMSPALGPMMAEMLNFVVRGFRVGGGMEDTIEKGFQQFAQEVQQQKQAAAQQPNPQMLEVQQRGQIAQAELQLEERGQQAEHMREVQKQNSDTMLQVRKQNLDNAANERKRQDDAQAQVRDRAAKMLSGKPLGRMQ